MKKDTDEKYIEAVGRRKTSTARVRLTVAGRNSFIVNGKDSKEYFQTDEQKRLVVDPITTGLPENFDKSTKWHVEARVSGGGIHSQAEAIRHGLSRALLEYNQDFHETLKPLGYLKRDPRAKERRKFGLKKARKAPKWSKR